MRDGEGGVGFGLWVLGSWDGRGCVEWEEPIKERRVWEKGGDDGVGSVWRPGPVKGSGEGELWCEGRWGKVCVHQIYVKGFDVKNTNYKFALGAWDRVGTLCCNGTR